MPDISIIVPVYKSEKYIGRCIYSVIKQTYKNWELILVDDGSPDRSGEVCDNYMQKDSRIKVFHKKNKGVSAARNYGIEKSTSKFITFLDSDDWLDEDCIRICLKYVIDNKLDLLQFGYKRISESGKVIMESKISSQILTPILYINHNNYNVCVWGSIFKKSIIQEHLLRFDTRLKLGEDQKFFFQYISYSDKNMSISNTLYNYFLNYSGATGKAKSLDIISSMRILKKVFISVPISQDHFSKVFNDFLKDLLIKYDITSFDYKTLFLEFYTEQRVTNALLKKYILLSKINYTFAYHICGLFSSMINRIRTIIGRYLHKLI